MMDIHYFDNVPDASLNVDDPYDMMTSPTSYDCSLPDIPPISSTPTGKPVSLESSASTTIAGHVNHLSSPSMPPFHVASSSSST